MPIQFGVIGCGAIAQRRHIPEIEANRYGKVVAVSDPNEARVNDIAGELGAEAFVDHKKMLKAADLDAVVVCGPNALHAKQTVDALRAGCHVLVEKPMATSKAEAKRMIETARKARKYLMVGQNQRLMPAHVKARQVLDTGALGKVISFRTTFKHPGPDGWSLDGAKSWFFDPDAAFMGVTGDLGVHKVDLMRWLLGQEFETVGGTLATVDKRDSRGKLIGLDDNAILQLTTNKGVIGSVEISWTNYGAEENHTKLYCEKGAMLLGGDPEFGVVVDYRNGNRELHKVGAMASNVQQVSSGVADAFIDSIRKKRKPAIDGTEGYRSLTVILAAMDAAKQGKTVKIRY